jgi:DNA-binding MarR family transcriptional regulator
MKGVSGNQLLVASNFSIDNGKYLERIDDMTKKAKSPPVQSTIFLWLGKAYHAATNAFEESTGVTAARWRLLFLIHRQRGCTQKALISEIRVDPGSITRQLKALEAEKLIVREDDPADNRLTRVSLSPLGDKLVQGILEKRKRFLETMLQGIPPEEVDACIHVLERISMNVGDDRPIP